MDRNGKLMKFKSHETEVFYSNSVRDGGFNNLYPQIVINI